MGFKVTIQLRPGEKDKALKVIQSLINKDESQGIYPASMPISKIAREGHTNVNRMRYIVDELLLAGRLKKVPLKNHGRYHTRYYYEVVE